MISKIKLFLSSNIALVIVGIVYVAAPIISNECQFLWFQDEEPEGLALYAKKR